MTRLRIRFAKRGKVRWTSHRDTARMWERAFRRLSLPVAYSNGFSPRPRVSFGLALSTGYESVAEYLDVELTATPPDGGDPTLDLDRLTTGLSAALPEGVDVLAIAVGEDRLPSLQEEVTVCTWRFAVTPVDPDAPAPDIAAGFDQLLAADTVVVTRTRKGREVTEDIRPAIVAIRPLGSDPDGFWLECDLAAQPRSLRPTELVAALDADVEARAVCRVHQWIERDGARWEPLAAPSAAPDASHALERAS